MNEFRAFRNVYVEITKSEHSHGGTGWEFGTCLWSPSRNKSGADYYSLMREPVPGDLVFHIYSDVWSDSHRDTRLCGYSLVDKSCYEVKVEPPLPGNWVGMPPYYRIDLKDYTAVPSAVPVGVLLSEYADRIREDLELNAPVYYPFYDYGGRRISTVQGRYLSRCTQNLFSIFQEALHVQSAAEAIELPPVFIHKEYREGRRMTAERRFFARNPKLAVDARKQHGCKCQVCGFSFEQFYGEIGHGFIEVHHKDPLSERSGSEGSDEFVSTLDDVAALCSNCHSMIHRKTPALTVSELQILVQKKIKLPES